jgi:hypothetical protein
MAALTRGEIWRALLLNPLVAVTLLGILAAAAGSFWRRLTGRAALRCSLGRREEIVVRSAVAAAVALNWIYLLLRS